MGATGMQSVLWGSVGGIVLALVITLCAVWTRDLRTRPRATGVDWSSALLLELAVAAAAGANVLAPGALFDQRSASSSAASTFTALPPAIVAVLAFALSIALLHMHRRLPDPSPNTVFARRAAVGLPGAVGYGALVVGSLQLHPALPLQVVAVFMGAALTGLIGLLLIARGVAMSLAGMPAPVAEREPEDAPVPLPVAEPALASPSRAPSRDPHDPYRRPEAGAPAP